MKNIDQIKISYLTKTKLSQLPKILGSSSVAELAMTIFDQDTIGINESFYVLYLNNSLRVKGYHLHSTGAINGCLVDIRIVLAIALKSLSTSLVLVHNHPSGTLNPSEADKKLTRKIKDGAALLDIKLLDHVIINPEGNYYSFADDGLL